MERGTFIFYRSFYDAIKDLEDEQFAKVFRAICDYALNETEPTLQGVEKALFTLVKPSLDSGIKNYKNGCKPKTKATKPNESEEQAKSKPNESEEQAYKYKDKYEDKYKDFNLKEKEEKEKSSAFFESFIDLYEIKPDISSLTVVRDLDFKKVLKAWGESKWLKTEIKSLRWVVNNYQKIIAGEYKDKATYKAKEEEPKEESEYDKKRKKNLEIIKKSSHEWGFDSGVACFLGLDLDYVQEGDLPISIEQYKRETA